MFKYEKFWDRIANRYAKAPIKDEEAFNAMVENIRVHLKDDDTVLDFGCGTGTYSIAIADKVKAIRGIDISKKMLAIANERASKRHLQNIQFDHLTLFDEKLKPACFDVVLTFNILHLQEDLDGVLNRISELLVPGGLLISKAVCIGEKLNLIVRLMQLLCKTGLVPYVGCMNYSQLESSMKAHKLEILETKQNPAEPLEYFIVARKC